MSDFDKREWMAETCLKPGEWERIKSMPLGIYCDVMLFNGKEVGPCWPLNNGIFVDLATEEKIESRDVKHIRPYRDADPEKSSDEDDEDEDSEESSDEAYDRQRHHVDSVED